jgi:transposase
VRGIDTSDPASYTVADGDGQTKAAREQESMWVATQDLPRSAGHPFYARLNQILDEHDFDGYVEGLCEHFYADDGRPEAGIVPRSWTFDLHLHL